MSTFSQLTDQTLMQLYGYTTLQDQATYLTASATASATSLTVNDVTAISRGIIEIGDEIIWVDSFDSSTKVLTVPPYGRGFRGSTAVAHNPGERVTSSPMFPRMMVKNAINQAITSVYPELFGIGETTFAYQPSINTFSLPAGAKEIISISWQTTGPSKEWMPIRRYRVDRQASTSVFASGVSVSIYDMIVPGRTVKVTYTKEPTALVNDSDDFATVTGLPASCEDLVMFGAAYRLTPYFDSSKLSGQSAAADFNDRTNQANTASALSRFLLQMYQVRLAEEARGLQNIFAVRSHYTR